MPARFNMTPIIDIVFLLIIFFLVVCQFIEAENFPVTVPDGCDFAESDAEQQEQITTVTVMKAADGSINFAVGAKKITASSPSDLTEQIARLVDTNLKNSPASRRIVTLRIDKDVNFAQAQYALAGVAASTATDIKLAALKDKHSLPQ